MCVSSPSRCYLTWKLVPRFLSHLHSGYVSIPYKSATFRSHFKPIQVSRCASQIHPCPASPASRSHDYCLTSIHAEFHLHSMQYIRISPPPPPPPPPPPTTHHTTHHPPPPPHVPIFVIFVIHLHLHIGLEIWKWPQSRLPDSCILSIHIVFNINKGTYLHLISIQFTSHLHLGPKNSISDSSSNHLKHIKVSSCATRIHPGPVSP